LPLLSHVRRAKELLRRGGMWPLPPL
jgi:hypothetical protein